MNPGPLHCREMVYCLSHQGSILGGGPLFPGASEELETGLVEAQREQGLEEGAGELGRT